MPLACAALPRNLKFAQSQPQLLWLTISNGIPVFRDSFGRLIGVIEINTICLNDLGDRIATCTRRNIVRVGAS